MDFELTHDRHDDPRPEIKYRLDVDPETYPNTGRLRMRPCWVIDEKDGVPYRILGEGDST